MNLKKNIKNKTTENIFLYSIKVYQGENECVKLFCVINFYFPH